MKVLELFAGTRSIGKAFEQKGHEVFSVEWDKDFENIDLYQDINTITAEDILRKFGRPDVIWASPDCSTFSIAAISHHRRRNEETGNLEPVSEYAKFCDEVDQHVLHLIDELKPQFYFIENPRGGMRKMSWMQGLPRYTVTYCQYGDSRMKPTDIWTNHPNPQFKPMCKNGDPCHERAPRGSKTGTQGLKGSKERSVIPDELCKHIVEICERYIKRRNMNYADIQKIADTYGYDSQSRMLIEEMAELTKAINKAWRTVHSGKCDTKEKLIAFKEKWWKNHENIIEEIADVEIMLAQIKYLMRCNSQVIEVREQKIARQLERIEKEKTNE